MPCNTDGAVRRAGTGGSKIRLKYDVRYTLKPNLVAFKTDVT
jgi:hypothetical protein